MNVCKKCQSMTEIFQSGPNWWTDRLHCHPSSHTTSVSKTEQIIPTTLLHAGLCSIRHFSLLSATNPDSVWYYVWRSNGIPARRWTSIKSSRLSTTALRPPNHRHFVHTNTPTNTVAHNESPRKHAVSAHVVPWKRWHTHTHTHKNTQCRDDPVPCGWTQFCLLRGALGGFKMVTTRWVCDPTIYGILIVSHIKTHTLRQGSALMSLFSLLCIPCKHTVHCIYNWRQFSPWWWRE